MSIGLEVNRLPSPEPSRLDDWFLGAGRGSQPRSAPVLFFTEVHEELTKLWTALLQPEAAHLPPPSSLHLMCSESITWRNCPRLLSKACKLTAALAAKAYSAAGQAALPCMPWLSCRSTKPRHSNKCTRVVPTTSAQVTLLNPEMGMVPRYSSRYHHANAFPLIQPLHGPCLSTGQSALRTIASSCRLLQ